jgi:hypothetical protein
LVDFSRSILISLYFAIEHEKKECNAAIWAVNRFRLWSYRRYYYGDELTDVGEWAEINGVWPKEAVKNYISFPKDEMEVILAKPFRINQRLQYQQGEFLIPSSLCNNFMENLSTTMTHSYCEIDDFYEDKVRPYCDFSSSDPATPISEINPNDKYSRYGVIKIEVPVEFHEELRRLLRNLNVSAGILFPDLEGIIRDLDHEGD